MRFVRPAIVLKQPLLVFIVVAFTVGVLLAGLWPDEETAATQPTSGVAWLFWLVVLAVVALGVWMLCHGEEIAVDGTRRQVTQTHRFLHRAVKTNVWSFADFTAAVVTLKIDKEQQGALSPSGASTLTTARTVYTRRYELNLLRPDLVLKTAERALTAPRHALRIPLPADTDPLAVETAAQGLAALGGWPALRRHYTLRPTPGAQPPYAIAVVAGSDEPLS